MKFEPKALRKIRVVADNLLERKVALNERHRDNFEEFIALNAAEAKIVFTASRYRPRVLVDQADANLSILKCNTTLTAGCPPSEERIREGKLAERDLFFFRGDYEKFQELDVRVEDIAERPLHVARLFLGRIPEISAMRKTLGWAIQSPALPLQSLIWKFKYDIINRQRSTQDILSWMQKAELRAHLRGWPASLQ